MPGFLQVSKVRVKRCYAIIRLVAIVCGKRAVVRVEGEFVVGLSSVF